MGTQKYFIQADPSVTYQSLKDKIDQSSTGTISDHYQLSLKIFKDNSLTYICTVLILICLSISISQLIPIVGYLFAPYIPFAFMNIVRKYINHQELGEQKYNQLAPIMLDDLIISYRKILTLSIYRVLTGIITMIGYALLIIPGLYCSLAFALGNYIIFDKNTEFNQAIKISRELFHKHAGFFIKFGITIIGINLLGVLCFGIGLIVSIPITIFMTLSLYYKLDL